MIVRLMRMVSSLSPRRCFTALTSNCPFEPRSTTKPRSAWTKILNRLSSNFGSTVSTASELRRFSVISMNARSLTSGLTFSRIPAAPAETSSFDMIVERASGSSTNRAESASVAMPTAGGSLSLG